ncbi:MAG TPA: hypothetical protein VFJ85_19575 [Acidimicrobiales bacterium]|nr:hypothetical protein [Acidimicrobiales bacterium]
MSFMVNFRSAEGKPGYHPTETLDEAVRFVEHLRNQEHVTDARVWRLQEVPLEVKTYYKVVVPAVAGAAPAPPVAHAPEIPVPVADADPAPKVDAAVGAPGPEAVGAPGSAARFGRFNRS